MFLFILSGSQSWRNLWGLWWMHMSILRPASSLASCERLAQDDGPLIFNGLSLSIPSGSSCALVGRTGCGKSSFLSALVRLYPLCGGKLYLHGILIDERKGWGHDWFRVPGSNLMAWWTILGIHFRCWRINWTVWTANFPQDQENSTKKNHELVQLVGFIADQHLKAVGNCFLGHIWAANKSSDTK